MNGSWFKFTYIMMHPSFILQYLNRVSLIASLINVSKKEVKKYLREYSYVNADIESKLTQLPYLGWMDRRKNEILYALVRITKPKIVIETGVGAGVSSAIILNALERNHEGHLYSIDAGLTRFDNIARIKSIGFLVPENLKGRWTLKIGFSREILSPLLKQLGVIDFFFHDSEHTYENMMFEYCASYKALKVSGMLVSDNIEWNNAFDEFCKRTKSPYIKLYSLGVIKKHTCDLAEVSA